MFPRTCGPLRKRETWHCAVLSGVLWAAAFIALTISGWPALPQEFSMPQAAIFSSFRATSVLLLALATSFLMHRWCGQWVLDAEGWKFWLLPVVTIPVGAVVVSFVSFVLTAIGILAVLTLSGLGLGLDFQVWGATNATVVMATDGSGLAAIWWPATYALAIISQVLLKRTHRSAVVEALGASA